MKEHEAMNLGWLGFALFEKRLYSCSRHCFECYRSLRIKSWGYFFIKMGQNAHEIDIILKSSCNPGVRRLPVKGHMVNNLAVQALRFLPAATLLCHCSVKIDNS